MKKNKFEINAKNFYKIGKYLFFASGIGMVAGLIDNWSSIAGSDIVTRTATLIFNFTLSAFFAYMQGQEDYKEVKDPDIIKMNEALDKLNLEEEINATVQKERNNAKK